MPVERAAVPTSGRPTGTAVIELTNVSHAYPGSAEVLHAVNLTLSSGEFVCLVGPNGGGKTTLLRLILGLLSPTAGTIRVFGRRPAEVRRRLGYVPQRVDLDPQFPVNAIDVVLMGRLGHGRRIGPYSRDDRRIASAALDEVGLAEHLGRSFSELSGGQRQRALIARALTSEPDLLLLDEPTANLDPGMQDDFYKLLSELNRRMTLVLVSHDAGFVSRLVQTIVCVNRTVAVHPSSELTGDAIRALYETDVRLVRHDQHEVHRDDHTHG